MIPAQSSLAALAARIEAALPQTQCTRCGYPDCRSYAQAVAQGDAEINQCPPGGAEGIQRLSQLTGRPLLPLDPDCGQEGPRSIAVIDEDWCIGCTLCLDVCPTDAILGANKRMHTVIEAHCTGCERCIPVCPVDCIQLENVTDDATGWNAWSEALAAQALQRYRRRQERLSGAAAHAPQSPPAVLAEVNRSDGNVSPPRTTAPAGDSASARSAAIAAALERARQQRAKHSG